MESYQSAVNCQKKESAYFLVLIDRSQLLNDGSCYWFLSFSLSRRAQVCDNLRTSLTLISKKMLEIYFPAVPKKMKSLTWRSIHFINRPMARWLLFALPFASALPDGKLPIDARFVVSEMRNHFIIAWKKLPCPVF